MVALGVSGEVSGNVFGEVGFCYNSANLSLRVFGEVSGEVSGETSLFFPFINEPFLSTLNRKRDIFCYPAAKLGTSQI
jgi:hypothetical protein